MLSYRFPSGNAELFLLTGVYIMSINYRVDCLPRQPAGTDYRVPCGMNSIIWSSNSQPNIFSLCRLLSPMIHTKSVGVVSKWNQSIRDFEVIYIINK